MTTESRLDDALRAVVVDAYRVFGRYAAPTHHLNACSGCCMNPQDEQEMRTLPLALVTRRHFYEYNTAAKDRPQPADELRYLLPRMLELLAQGEEIHHSIELALDRVGMCDPEVFDDAERAVLERFALAYFDCTLAGVRPGHEHRFWDGPVSVLLMFHIGGVHVGPLLTRWMRDLGPESTAIFVEAAYWELEDDGNCRNAFAKDQPGFRAILARWVTDPVNRERWARKLLAPDFLRLAEHRGGCGAVDFRTMIDGVFDRLTQ